METARLTDILRRHALGLNTRCGGKGLCDGCLVEVVSGVMRHRVTGQHALAGTGGQIRACEHQLDGVDVTISIPPRSMLAYEPQVVSNFKINVSRAHDPIWRVLQLPPSKLSARDQLSRALDGDAVTAEEGVAEAISQRPVGSAIVAEYLADGWHAHVSSDGHLVNALGVAIDIGTTTVALLVVDLTSGEVVASASGFNRQMHLGDDVLTRINLCSTDRTMLARLQWSIARDTIERLLLHALKEAHLSDERIACLVIAANTTMLHLFAGVDPTPMGFAPFTAPFLQHKLLHVSEAQLKLSSRANGSNGASTVAADPSIHLLPSAAAYVGADITAGVVSSGLAYDDGPALLVDIGTNGEIVLKHDDKMWGTATAAGPAFEGSRMACGMRAGQGAISHVRIKRDETGAIKVDVDVIGGVRPTGICGSAYVDFLAQAREVGLLSAAGRLEHGIADDRIAPFRTYGTSFRVATGHGQEPIVICEADIASLLQAKAAIAAGILTLLRKIGIAPAEIKRLYLAGGFGMHLDIPNTIRSGLLPGFRPDQVELVGNTSLAGAYLSLLDVGILGEIKRVARAIDIVELNLDPEFESCYIDQLSLE